MRQRGWVVATLLLVAAPAVVVAASAADKSKPAASARAATAPAASAPAAKPAPPKPGEPVPIPFHDQTVTTHRPSLSLDLTFPAFDHPSPIARAAIAALVDRELAEFTKFTPAAGNAGGVQLDCEVTQSTTLLISFVCRSMTLQSPLVDNGENGGGAPDEATVTTYLLLLDGDRVRAGTLGDLLANPARDAPIVLKKIQAALTAACAGQKLLPKTSIDRFSVSDEGVSFYFSSQDFDLLKFDPSCERKAALSRAELRPLRKVGGVLDRLGSQP